MALALLVPGTALAHADLTRVTPAAGSTVTAPAAITLQFSEPLTTRFSTFRVMKVPAGTSPQKAADKALAQRPWPRGPPLFRRPQPSSSCP
nr:MULTISPECIES: copper resistance protein CopC [unclassified Deinococcus]